MRKYYKVEKGEKFVLERRKQMADITKEMLDSGEEIDSARGAIGQLGGRIEAIRDYAIPGTDVTHRVVVIRKVKDTPPQFPRSWARMKKAPLK